MTNRPHIHTSDCDCGCRKTAPHHCPEEARQLVERALVLSKTWSGLDGNPMVLAEQVRSSLRHLAGQLTEDGIILGHLKAFLCCGATSLGFSVTRMDTLDETPSPLWPPPSPADWYLAVNVLSLVHTDAVTEETLDALFD